jgi:hypothetical protein
MVPKPATQPGLVETNRPRRLFGFAVVASLAGKLNARRLEFSNQASPS